jgi:uncharacterized protein (DUF58 family)
VQLTFRAYVLLLVTSLFLLAAWWWPTAVWGALAWLILIAAMLLADWQVSPKPRQWTLRRSHDNRLSLAAPNRITIHVTLRQGLRPIQVFVRDTPPANFGLPESSRVLRGLVTPGLPTEFSYDVVPPRRGDYSFGDLYIRWETVVGLLRRQTRVAAAAPVKVYPNLVDVRKYDLMLRRNRLWELGLRSVRTLGGGAEFERLRDYTPDDEYRRISWKATARRGKPISMEFESERSQNIYCLLDIGRMMRSPVGEVAKMDYAINAVLLLAYVAAQKGDRIALLTFADRVETYVAPQGGKVQFQRMLEQLYAVEGQPIEPDYNAAFSYFAAHQHKRGLVLVFTDLTGSITTEALIAQMTRLRRRHLPLLVTLGDPTVQRLARQVITDSASLYQRTAAEQLLDERQLTLDRLRQRGVQTLDVPADELSVAVINRYLAIKEQMRL